MAYDENFADDLRAAMAHVEGLDERKMFGGLCFTVHGHMACGIAKGELMVRVGKDAYEAALAREHAKEMTFTGRAIKTMIYVEPAGFRTQKQLAGWVAMGVEHARSLPPKRPKANGAPGSRSVDERHRALRNSVHGWGRHGQRPLFPHSFGTDATRNPCLVNMKPERRAERPASADHHHGYSRGIPDDRSGMGADLGSVPDPIPCGLAGPGRPMIRRAAALLTIGFVPATAHAHNPDCAADVIVGVTTVIGLALLAGLVLFVSRIPTEVAWYRRALRFVVVATLAVFGGIGVWMVLVSIGYVALCG